MGTVFHSDPKLWPWRQGARTAGNVFDPDHHYTSDEKEPPAAPRVSLTFPEADFNIA
jgi:hypothetical protein